MRRIWWLLIIAALFPVCSHAQVTATVSDLGGQTWNNASYTISLVSPGGSTNPGPPFFLIGSNTPVPNQVNVGALTSVGFLSISTLTPNANISPAGTVWKFQICPTASSYCFYNYITITSANQNISAFLVPPAIAINMANPPLNTTAYSDAEVVNATPGQQYFNVTTSLTRLCVASPCIGSNWTNQGGGGAGGVSLATDNTFTNNNRFKGPIPWRDITAFGARATNAQLSTTVSCTANSTTVSVTSPSTFINGDGIVAYGCGATNTMTTPAAPTVTSGESETYTIPTAFLASIPAGTTTYNYKLVARDQNGGLTLPSSATTFTTGPSTLGAQTFTVASESLTGNNLTVVTSAPNNLVAGTLVHISGSTNAGLSGWFNITSITNGTTFVINNIPVSSPTTVTSTGGSLTYFQGNQLTWTNTSGSTTWQYIICASRPADSGAYHVIGLSYPFLPGGGTSGAFTFMDWGAVLSTAPSLPSYITDSVCTAGAPVNDYLSTTINFGAGSNTWVLTTAPSQTISGQTLLLDAAPAFRAAAALGPLSAQVSDVYVPPDTNGSSFIINSLLNLSAANVAIHQQGNIITGETIIGAPTWSGDELHYPSINNNQGAYPTIFLPTGSQTYDYLSFLSSGNQSLQLLWDTGNDQGGLLHNISFGTQSNPADYSGIGLAVRPGRFAFRLENLNFSPGLTTYTDQTWTPTAWLMYSNSGIGQSSFVSMQNLISTARAFYVTGAGFPDMDEAINLYIQGAIMPTLTLQNVNAGSGQVYAHFARFHNDTSPQPLIAILRTGANSAALPIDIFAEEMTTGTTEVGGQPPYITGANPNAIFLLHSQIFLTSSTPAAPLYFTNTMNSSSFHYYANDSVDAGNLTNFRGITTSTWPLTSSSGSFVPLGTPIQSAPPTVSAGGTDLVGTNSYCVVAIGWNSGWSAASCQNATLTTGNQTVTLTWSAIPNVQGYVVIENSNKCIPASNQNCTGISTTATSLVYSGGSGCCFAVTPPTISGDGQTGFNQQGLFGSKWYLLNNGVNDLFTSAGTANRTTTDPDVSGTLAKIGVGVTPANGDCLKYIVAGGVATLGDFGAACGTGSLGTNLESIRLADQFAGADWCAKVTAADADLGATPGMIWVNQNAGTAACAAGIALSANHLIVFIQGGTWNLGANSITFTSGSGIVTDFMSGGAVGSVTITRSGASGTALTSANQASTINAVKLRGFTLSCTGGAANTEVGLDSSGWSNSDGDNISITNCGTDHLMDTAAGGSTVYNTWYHMSYTASSASSGFLGLVIKHSSNAQHWYGARFSRLATQMTIGASGTATDQDDCFSCTFELPDTQAIDVVNAFGINFAGVTRFESVPLAIKVEAVCANQIRLEQPYFATTTTQVTDLSGCNGYQQGLGFVGTTPVTAGDGVKLITTGSGSALTTSVADTGLPASGTVASGTAALGTSAIASGTCATAVTVSATGVATTDDIQADFNADPTSTTGYAPSASGMLTIIKFPTANNVNFRVCNNTAGSITPGAVTLNWRVMR